MKEKSNNIQRQRNLDLDQSEEDGRTSFETRLMNEQRREKDEFEQMDKYRKYWNYTLLVCGLTLFLLCAGVEIPQFFYCLLASGFSSLWIVFCSFFPKVYFHSLGKWFYGFYFLVHLLIALTCVVLEGILMMSYSDCEKGFLCSHFKSFPYHWPYSVALAFNVLVFLCSVVVFYYYIILLFVKMNEDQVMQVASQENGIQLSNRPTNTNNLSTQYSPLQAAY
jgi:hypothetical protein